jgi:hypothetical protein
MKYLKRFCKYLTELQEHLDKIQNKQIFGKF